MTKIHCFCVYFHQVNPEGNHQANGNSKLITQTEDRVLKNQGWLVDHRNFTKISQAASLQGREKYPMVTANRKVWNVYVFMNFCLRHKGMVILTNQDPFFQPQRERNLNGMNLNRKKKSWNRIGNKMIKRTVIRL